MNDNDAHKFSFYWKMEWNSLTSEPNPLESMWTIPPEYPRPLEAPPPSRFVTNTINIFKRKKMKCEFF